MRQPTEPPRRLKRTNKKKAPRSQYARLTASTDALSLSVRHCGDDAEHSPLAMEYMFI